MGSKYGWLGDHIRELEARNVPPPAVAGPSRPIGSPENYDWLDEYLRELEFLNPPPFTVPPVDLAPEIDLPIDNECYAQRFCPMCVVNFARPGDLDRHLFEIHGEYFHPQQGRGNTGPQITFSQSQHAINGMFSVYKANLSGLAVFKDVDKLFESASDGLTELLVQELHRRRNLRAIFSIQPVFSRTNPATGEIEYTDGIKMPTMRSFDHLVLDSAMIGRILDAAMNKIAGEVEDFVQNGSGWVLERIEEFAVKIITYTAIKGSSYIDLPPLLAAKSRTLLNIRNTEVNEDQDHLKCFLWSVLAHPHYGGIPDGPQFKMHRHRHGTEVRTYKPHMWRLNLQGLKFPMRIQDLPKFEKLNPAIGITVIAYEMGGESDIDLEEDADSGADAAALARRRNRMYARRQEEIRDRCYPCYVCPENRSVKVDLLLLVADTNECDTRPDHYVYVKSLISLLHTHKNKQTKAICRNCLQTFREERTCEIHRRYCAALRMQKTTFPQIGCNTLEFKRYDRTQRIPFVIYGDFECFLQIVEPYESNTKTTCLQEHVPSGYSWICVDHHGYVYAYGRYRALYDGDNVAKRFLKEIIELCDSLQEVMKEYQHIAKTTMNVEEEKRLELIGPGIPPNARCYFCKGTFPRPNETNPVTLESKRPVRHHLHLDPYTFMGWSHNSCNLNASMSDVIPVIMHNFSSYDSHIVVQACDKSIVKKFEIIPKTSEKFLSITINDKIRFTDSYAFFNKSLAALAASLSKEDFRITRQMFGIKQSDENLAKQIYDCTKHMETNEEIVDTIEKILYRSQVYFPSEDDNVELLTKKQAYPYCYFTSVSKFSEEKLPPPESFYNDLAEKEIEPETYEHMQKVWQRFGLRDLADLHNLYVTLDTSLLADIFESNRRTMFKHYELEIAHYLSLPMVSKDALLKKTGAQLELLTDSTMYCFLEGGVRGGLVSVGSLRSAEANNPYLGDEYQADKATSYITFLDANNEYAWALSEPLPEKHFEWVEEGELLSIGLQGEKFFMDLHAEDRKGYILECDLDIPASCHDFLNDYPPAPVKRVVKVEELSLFQRNMMDKAHTPPSVLKTERLIADLLPKRNMICHYRNLQMWLRLGCKLKKIHKVLKFTQSKWMKPYIDFNTRMRQLAISDIEIEFWKMLNNCGFGKMIEKKRLRQNIIAIMTETKGKLYNKKPTLDDIRIIHEGLVFLIMKKLAVTLNNPIAVGFACLELSKLVMFNFHYFYMKSKFGNMARLLYSDTDSFCYFVEYPNKDGDIYVDFKSDEEQFDLSGYDEHDPVWGRFYSPRNKKVLGKFHDEMSNCVISHFVGPKPKMYTVRYIKHGLDKISGNRICKVNDKKKAKGLGKAVVENVLRQEHYINALLGKENEDISMVTIRSFKHVLKTVRQNKKSVSGIDIKRFCLDDCVSTLAFGHKDIPIFL